MIKKVENENGKIPGTKKKAAGKWKTGNRLS
jgi:hypothetical protein